MGCIQLRLVAMPIAICSDASRNTKQRTAIQDTIILNSLIYYFYHEEKFFLANASCCEQSFC